MRKCAIATRALNASATHFALGRSGQCYTDDAFFEDIDTKFGTCYERWDCHAADPPCITVQGGVGGVDSLDVYTFETEPNSAVIPVST